MATCGRRDFRIALRTACLAAAVGGGSCPSPAQQDPTPAPMIDVAGTTLRVRLGDGSTREGAALVGAVLAVAVGGQTLRVRIAGVETDAGDCCRRCLRPRVARRKMDGRVHQSVHRKKWQHRVQPLAIGRRSKW